MPGKCAQPLGQISLEVVFRDPNNLRIKTLSFEVVDFRGAYRAILGRPAYAKFMARLCYVYLNLKMPGPNGVITMNCDLKRSFRWDVASINIAESYIAVAELDELKQSVDTEQAPLSRKATLASAFQLGQDTKKV